MHIGSEEEALVVEYAIVEENPHEHQPGEGE
jgi:hypothetical protein